MKEEILSQRILLLCGCASLEAKGDLRRLDLAIREALDKEVCVNELKDAFAHSMPIRGFPVR